MVICPLFEINNKLKTISAKKVLGSSFGRAIVFGTMCSWFDSNPKYNSLVSFKITCEMYRRYASHFFYLILNIIEGEKENG